MKHLIKSWSIFASLVVIYIIVLACGGGDWDENTAKTSFFTQNTLIENDNDQQYKPFLRLLTEPYYGSNGTISSVDFWYNYFDKKITTTEIENLLLNTNLTAIDHLIFYNKDNKYSKISASLKAYAINTYSDKAKVNEFLYYLGFAKRCETYSVSYEASWDENIDEKKLTLKGIQELINGGLNAIKNPKSAAIQERYQFQLVRLYFHKAQQFDKKYEDAIQYYESVKNQFTIDPLMKYRSMGYVAASYYKKADYSNANYLYSLIYDQCADMKVVAQFSFHPMNESDFAATIKKAKNVREQCVLWHLLGLYADEARAIKNIYALDPKSDLLNLLLVRHISIIEESALPGNYSIDYEAEIEETKDDSLFKFLPYRLQDDRMAQLKKIADAGNTQRPYLWSMAYGYIAVIKNDVNTANQYFEKAMQQNTGNTLVPAQIRVCKLLMKANNLTVLNPTIEDEFYKEFVFVDRLKDEDFFKEDIKSFVLKRLAEQYIKQNDMERATLCQTDFIPNYYYDTKSLDRMIAFLSKSNFTNYETYMKNQYPYKLNDLYETEGIRLTYQGKIDEAIAKLEQAGAGSTTLLANPFNIHINDCHDCDHAATQKRTFTKIEFLKEIKKMEGIAASTKSATDYYLLGNAYYNMTYFGNARLFYSTAITDNNIFGTFYFPLDEEWGKPNDLDMYIFDCSKAEKYYMLAAANTTDNEMKAKCTFMAAKCEQNKYFTNKEQNDERDFKSGKYFATLLKEYKNTNYYNEILKECGYFETYVASKK